MIRSDGIPFEIGARDFDHDGQVDVMFAVIDPGIFKIIGMLARGIATNSALLDLNLYRMEGSGRIPTSVTLPTRSRRTPLAIQGRKRCTFRRCCLGM